MHDRPRDLVLLSGGLDSTTALAAAVADGTAHLALSVDYGQRHQRELRAAEAIALGYGVPWDLLELLTWGQMLTTSALTNRAIDVPTGTYTTATLAATIVPNRNATLIMAAAAVAQARGCDRVVIGAHAGDHAVYPDTRPHALAAVQEALTLCTDGAVTLHTPLVHLTKRDIVRAAAHLAAPVADTWSCYLGGEQHCGTCSTCTERRQAFIDAGVPDPTAYAGAAP